MNTTETQLEFDFMKPEQLSFTLDTGPHWTLANSFTTNFTPSVIFQRNGKQVGVLSWENGPMKFEGDVEESAQLFFEHIIKRYVQTQLEWKS